MTWYGIFVKELGQGPVQSGPDFNSGPYRVVRKLNDVNYVIQLTAKSRAIIVHVNKLRSYKEFQLA